MSLYLFEQSPDYRAITVHRKQDNCNVWDQRFYWVISGPDVNPIYRKFIIHALDKLIGAPATYCLLTRCIPVGVEIPDKNFGFLGHLLYDKRSVGKLRTLWNFLRRIFTKGTNHARTSNDQAS